MRRAKVAAPARPAEIAFPDGTLEIISNGEYNVMRYGAADVNVPNTYTAGDEGKVVSSGALVAQTSRNLYRPGTYDTTTNDEVTVVPAKLYAFHVDGDESDPSDAVTYLHDAVGMTPAGMDYVNDRFDWGSWGDAFFIPRPCMLKNDGTVDYYLDPDDYTKKADGTASDVADATYGGNAMMEWGRDGKKIWIKIVPDEGETKSGTVCISDEQIDADFHAWPFVDSAGNVADHFYTAIYNGSVTNSVMRSLSGQQVSKSLNASENRTAAQANNPSGSDAWDVLDYGEWLTINILLTLIAKTLDTQSAYGEGLHTGGSEAVNDAFRTGVHDAKGLFYGTNSGAASTYTNASKVFGMENWWGFQWKWLLGYILSAGTQKLKLTKSTVDGTTTADYNTDGSGYISIPDATPSGASGGYISESVFSASGIAPKAASGTAATYWCDGLWFDNSGTRFALVGGSSSYGARVGAWYVNLNNDAANRNWNIGASLLIPKWYYNTCTVSSFPLGKMNPFASTR